MNKYILCLLFFVISFSSHANKQTEVALGDVHEVVLTQDNERLFVTSTGTWRIEGEQLVRIGDDAMLSLNVLPQAYRSSPWGKSHWLGVGYVIVIIVLSLVYLGYQASLNNRRREYYERIKVQQKIVDIALLATGEEIVDCNITTGVIERLNVNTKFLTSNELYFADEAFLSRLHEDDRGIFTAQFDALLHGGASDYEVTYRLKDVSDNWIWVTERGCIIERDQQGHAHRLVASLRDMSVIMQEQEQLTLLTEELEKRLRSAKLTQQQ